jgi:hypothetical protein
MSFDLGGDDGSGAVAGAAAMPMPLKSPSRLPQPGFMQPPKHAELAPAGRSDSAGARTGLPKPSSSGRGYRSTDVDDSDGKSGGVAHARPVHGAAEDNGSLPPVRGVPRPPAQSRAAATGTRPAGRVRPGPYSQPRPAASGPPPPSSDDESRSAGGHGAAAAAASTTGSRRPAPPGGVGGAGGMPRGVQSASTAGLGVGLGSAGIGMGGGADGGRPVANPMQLIEEPHVVRQRAAEARELVARMKSEARAREERKRMLAAAESNLLSAELAVLDAGRAEKERVQEEERRVALERRREVARVSGQRVWERPRLRGRGGAASGSRCMHGSLPRQSSHIGCVQLLSNGARAHASVEHLSLPIASATAAPLLHTLPVAPSRSPRPCSAATWRWRPACRRCGRARPPPSSLACPRGLPRWLCPPTRSTSEPA